MISEIDIHDWKDMNYEQPELGGHSQQWVRDLLFSAHFCGSSAYHCTEVRRLLAPNDDIADEVISRESTRCARHARELLADKAQPERELPAIETLKIVVRDAFMNGISWMLGNKDSRLQEQNNTADWYVQQWVTSEHNPLNYQAPADKVQHAPAVEARIGKLRASLEAIALRYDDHELRDAAKEALWLDDVERTKGTGHD